MPKEVFSREEFLRIARGASEVRVKTIEKDGIAKVKARTRRYLYTLKIKLDELEGFLDELKKSIGEEKIVHV